MRGKEFLAALKIDAEGSLRDLSTLGFVFSAEKDETCQLHLEATPDKVQLFYAPASPPLTMKEWVEVLNEHKEAFLYLEGQPIYGYRLIEKGVILG